MMLESFIEEMLWKYPNEFFPNRGFKQFQKQYTLPSGGRFDLAFHDAEQRLWLIEVKAVTLKIDVVIQVHGYAMELAELHPAGPPPISMVVAPSIPPPIRTQLDYWGVAYAEIHPHDILAVANAHGEELPEQQPLPSTQPNSKSPTTSAASGSKSDLQAKFLARVRESYLQQFPQETLPWKETGSFLREPARLPDIALKWAFSHGQYRVEIQIYKKNKGGGIDTTYNRSVFDQLAQKRSEVEATLQRSGLKWNRDLGGGCGVFLTYSGSVNPQMLEDPIQSGSLVQWSTSEMKHLQDVVFPFLKPLL